MALIGFVNVNVVNRFQYEVVNYEEKILLNHAGASEQKN